MRRARPLRCVPSVSGALSFCVSVSRSDHRGRNQTVAVLHKHVAEIRQMRLLAIASLVQPRVRGGGRASRSNASARGSWSRHRFWDRSSSRSSGGNYLRRHSLGQQTIDGEIVVRLESLHTLIDPGEEQL